MMKKNGMLKPVLTLTALLVISTMASAQYYYNDIVNNKTVTADLARFKEQKVRAVKVTSLEADGQESEGFVCRKNINRDFTKVELYTQMDYAYPSIFTSFFSKDGLLEKTIDSSEEFVKTISYEYNSRKALTRIYSYTDFPGEDDADNVAEEHLYYYNEQGILTQLNVIKNARDTTNIIFMPDDNGNVSIEKNSTTSDIYYYYYDEKKNMTDVVHSYKGRTVMVPDYKFEYNYAGQIIKMIASEKEGAYYFTWRYTYDNGLRTTERCFSKEGKLIGSVEYENK